MLTAEADASKWRCVLLNQRKPPTFRWKVLLKDLFERWKTNLHYSKIKLIHISRKPRTELNIKWNVLQPNWRSLNCSGDGAEPPRSSPLLRSSDRKRDGAAGLPLHAQRHRPFPWWDLPAAGGDQHRPHPQVQTSEDAGHVSETPQWRWRVRTSPTVWSTWRSSFRYWLKGLKAGTKEVVLDNMIGYPDNIRLSDHGTFLVGIATPRFQKFLPPFLDLTAPYPAAKRFLVKVGVQTTLIRLKRH